MAYFFFLQITRLLKNKIFIYQHDFKTNMNGPWLENFFHICNFSKLLWIDRVWQTVIFHDMAQLSVKACLNTWLPKTLIAHQLQPNTTELLPCLVTCTPSNHGPQNFFFFPKTKPNITVGLKFDHYLFMTISCTQVHSPPLPPSSSIYKKKSF